MKTSANILQKPLLVLGVFCVTTFVSYGATSVGGGLFKSTPYTTINAVSDAQLSVLTNGTGPVILNGIIDKVRTNAGTAGGNPINSTLFNVYIDNYLTKVDQLDDAVRATYGSDYSIIFQYIYPRVLAFRMGGSFDTIFDSLSTEADITGTSTGGSGSTTSTGSGGTAIVTTPITPTAPTVQANDTENTVVGYSAATMEATLSPSTTYNSTLPADLTGNKTLKVRMKAVGTNPVSLDTTLNFTTNTVVSLAPTTVTVNTSSFLRVVEYYMCGAKEKDNNGIIKGLKSITQYNRIGFTADSHPIGVRYDYDSYGRPTYPYPASYGDCANICNGPSAGYSTLCGQSTITEYEDATTILPTNTLTLNVTKTQVKSGGEAIIFYGYIPSGTTCTWSYAGKNSGGSSSLSNPVSSQLVVGNGSYINTICNGVSKNFTFTEAVDPAISTPATTATNTLPTMTVNKATAKVGEVVTFTWAANGGTNCYWSDKGVLGGDLTGTSGSVPFTITANMAGGDVSITNTCTFNGTTRTSNTPARVIISAL